MDDDRPILDNHLHLDPSSGRGIDAVEEFSRAGGTHLLVVNKPSWSHGIDVDGPDDFHEVFEMTVETVERADAVLAGRAWPVLGVHPALITRLVEDRNFSIDAARELMCAGLDVAGEFAANGNAVALKSGRPHYDVNESIAAASNTVLRYGFAVAADSGVPIQLHTEAGTDFTTIAGWAQAADLPPQRVVKHYAAGRCQGPIGSVMSERDRLRVAAEAAEPFLMETDFLDDPDRPGAVLGPKTVPRRVDWLISEGFETAVRTAHIETPALVYDLDTRATLT